MKQNYFAWFQSRFRILLSWYFVTKIFVITRAIYSNSERSEQCLVLQNVFLTNSWKFLIYNNKLEQLKFKVGI